MELKKLPLHEEHVKLGGKMVPFGGWDMPVKYESILKEHNCVREDAGIFDISHMGEFIIKGKDAKIFLQSMVTNDVNLLEDGKAQYACMCYQNGTVVDDLFYYQEKDEELEQIYRVIVNASNREKDFEWFQSHIDTYNIELTDESDSNVRFAFQGPTTQEKLQTLVDMDLTTIKRFYFAHCNLVVDGEKIPLFLARTGYTGEYGYEITSPKTHAKKIFQALLSTGAKPIGLGARDSLRLDVAYSLYGHELSAEITPIEASIGFAVKNKSEDFIGKDILLKQKKEGTTRKIVGIELLSKGVMRDHFDIFHEDKKVGFTTSGGFSPSLKKSIALAMIDIEYAKIDTLLDVQIRNKRKQVKIIKTPFYLK